MGTAEKRVGRRFRLGKIIGRRYISRYMPEVNRLLSEPIESIRCMTFHQKALPDEILARMKANQERANLKIKQPAPGGSGH